MSRLMSLILGAVFYLTLLQASSAQVPDNLVVEGVPAIPGSLRDEVAPYLEFRGASFQSWYPEGKEMLISTRFGQVSQLHQVKFPGGARQQLTFFSEPIRGGAIQPDQGQYIVFLKDVGGGENYQLFRYDMAQGRTTLLTDGESRNQNALMNRSGRAMAYTSTRRTGRFHDIYIMDPARPASDHMLLEVTSTGWWGIEDWSRDEEKLLVQEYISINESYLYLVDAKTGSKRLLTPSTGAKVAFSQGQFAENGKSIFITTDLGSEFRQLSRMDLDSGTVRPLTRHIPWDISSFQLSPDGETLAFISNQNGIGRLHLMDADNGKERRAPRIPVGVLSGLEWHEDNRTLGFTFSSALTPSDAFSVDIKSGKLTQWTFSETGGLQPVTFSLPDLIQIESFDGLPVSGFVYKPDPKKFPGPRPVLLIIHGGPEGQTRPRFWGKFNYFINELGMALVFPNVRGSSGYGKTFLTLDNGFKREDSVKDIGAFIEWVQENRHLDKDRIAVMGGSYGGYMVLASMVHYNDQLRCGVDVVGISNFRTFLENTRDYRRDLRRAEYGDERQPAMKEFLEKISPANQADRIKKPLFVIQGKNDPRVPVTESEQMVAAIRQAGGQVWYLMAKDEGHGFRKKNNADYQFLSTILFFKQYLLNDLP